MHGAGLTLGHLANSHQASDRFEQIHQVDRFSKDDMRAEVARSGEAVPTSYGFHASRQGNDPDVWKTSTKLLDGFEAVFPRHDDVGNRDFDTLSPRNRERLDTVASLKYLVASHRQYFRHDLARIGVVLDEQDGSHRIGL